MKIVSKAWMRGFLNNELGATPGAGKLHGLYVGLITSSVSDISPDTVRADVTEAAYTGYARQAVGTWSAPYDTQDGKVQVDAPALLFQPSDAAVPENITGVCYFDASTNGNLVATDPLDTPYPLPDQYSGLSYNPVAALPFATNMGESNPV